MNNGSRRAVIDLKAAGEAVLAMPRIRPRYDLPSVTQAPSPWGEGRGLRGIAALTCGIKGRQLILSAAL
ncbi:hypothetical protein [Parasedimentitalea maritima]|uniref:Uncharacterized protein n=1 Tax=Parasedimentitalea maritima TaxID=2578117 RepID=A0A6A4RQ83_9RHOB|nr:hypothetical protein [Zongyanglinia marina]KAE9632404.1 hypothetical protein GP644_01100 [Zongyanglinia marina]